MRNLPRKFLIAALALAVMGSYVWIRDSRKHAGTHVPPETAVYYCPMHPSYTADRPGKCPICGMDLVKRKDAEAAKPAAALKEMTLEELLSLKPGEVCLLHKCSHGTCMVKMTEEIARSGKCPHCGDDLGVIIKEMAPSGYADLNLESGKQKILGIQTEPVKKVNMTKTIHVAGEIVNEPMIPGKIWFKGDLYEQDIPFVKRGQKIEIQVPFLAGRVWSDEFRYEQDIPLVKGSPKTDPRISSLPDTKFKGEVWSLNLKFNSVTWSQPMLARVENPKGLLKPGMVVNGEIEVGLGENVSVPHTAIFHTGDKSVVFVAKSDGKFEPREIQTGKSDDKFVEIKSGLAEGEQVVTSGNFLIDSESRLKAALEGTSKDAGGHQHGV